MSRDDRKEAFKQWSLEHRVLAAFVYAAGVGGGLIVFAWGVWNVLVVVGVLMLGLLVITWGLVFLQIRENRRVGRKVVVPWWGWVLFVIGWRGAPCSGCEQLAP